ncbi:2-hydroxyacid dehydrogenase [Pseudonocardia sp. TRM90224]|uniref:2-hydroxyacid dehydrogenase n=1 Tax=Pseudonocardia sp. TRM90224 TaxID=2812678 RepID=UPI001E5DA9D5|nr:2-hydroxyacid dehydrogenase [Pseudonocardia sp. TRM90224]
MVDIRVLVPQEEGMAAFAGVDGVTAVRYDGAAELPPEAADATVLIPPFLTTAVDIAQRMPKLQLVQLLTAGAEAWIGKLPESVALSDCRGAHGGATAEWVVMTLLAVYRHVPQFVRAQDGARWEYHQTEELAGKRVLIVGAGDVAEQLVRRLDPFDVSTTLVGRRARAGVHGIDEVHGLLPHHDACVVVVPLTDETRGLVDAEFLTAMPDRSVLVNGARGPVADTDALVAELASGRLRAALDVTEPEPLPPGHPLWNVPGLLLTPHVGASVPDGLRRAYTVAAQQVAAFARGEEPSNLVRNGY